jgi:hypothetical protein
MASRITYIVLFLIIFNATVALVDSYALAPTAIGYLGSSSAPTNPWGGAEIPKYVGASPTGNGYQQSANLGISGGSFSLVLVFGDFFWGLVHVAKIILMGVILPAYYLTQLGAPPALVTVVQLGIWVLYAYWVAMLITGRQMED